jgi:hypothetical protein
VLRDDSLDALEMSGHDMCRLLRFRPLNNDPEYLRGAGSEIVAGSLFGNPLPVLCHIHGHLLDENPDLKLFRRIRLFAKPLTDC